MKLALLVYLASIVNSLSAMFLVFGSVIMGLLVVFLMFLSDYKPIKYRKVEYSCDDKEEIKEHNERVPENNIKVKKIIKTSFAFGICFLVLATIIPKEKTVYLMVGAYATEQVVTNPRVQKISGDILDIVEKKLEELK